MSAVAAHIVRRFLEVSRVAVPRALLEQAGLSESAGPQSASGKMVSAEAYYAILEHCHAGSDAALPLRYGTASRPDDFGAFGLALKTAPTVNDGLERLVRYILVVTDSLAYRLVDEPGGRRVVLEGRSPQARAGVALANEAALAAILSVLRQAATDSVLPTRVSFRHAALGDTEAHAAYFGCSVDFETPCDALHFDASTLATDMRLSDQGLSLFLLSQLDDQRSQRVDQQDRSLVVRVRNVVTGMLCEGAPRRAQVARRLGMSERTLQRHLADQGQGFQALVNDVRREMAESLLAKTQNSLSEVAFLTGFSDQSAFQRAFKGWTGKTPLSYRQAAP